MIFKQYAQVLDGSKTQTRRPAKPSEILRYASSDDSFSHLQDEEFSIATVIMWAGDYIRIKWQVDRIYAVQPGRGKKAVGGIRITKIRRERLHEITLGDTHEELGMPKIHYSQEELESLAVNYFITILFVELWNSLYRKPPYRWQDNPECWVLEFEKVEK